MAEIVVKFLLTSLTFQNLAVQKLKQVKYFPELSKLSFCSFCCRTIHFVHLTNAASNQILI